MRQQALLWIWKPWHVCYKFSFKSFKLIFLNSLAIGLPITEVHDERICRSLYLARSFSTIESISLLNIDNRKSMCLREFIAHLVILLNMHGVLTMFSQTLYNTVKVFMLPIPLGYNIKLKLYKIKHSSWPIYYSKST